MNCEIPWVEKYRPTSLNKIVLTPLNKLIFNNIIDKNTFPNILFFGPPGTGKTTTIINLIKEYNEKYNFVGTDHIMHLNASDERGVEVIRNQIHSFVNSNSLFKNNIKFVILDEVDYMTKSAQISLKNLLGQYKNVRYCLICNYISKIDKSLQEQFIHFRFNQLPKQEIYNFLQTIITTENLKISKKKLMSIINDYDSDIRSMINYIQSNVVLLDNINFFSIKQCENLCNSIGNYNYNSFYIKINKICCKYNINNSECIKQICYYVNTIYPHENYTQYIIHNLNLNKKILTNYLLSRLKQSFANSCSKK